MLVRCLKCANWPEGFLTGERSVSLKQGGAVLKNFNFCSTAHSLRIILNRKNDPKPIPELIFVLQHTIRVLQIIQKDSEAFALS
jgi:hypothetical protein